VTARAAFLVVLALGDRKLAGHGELNGLWNEVSNTRRRHQSL
jgi:hypothetical protein